LSDTDCIYIIGEAGSHYFKTTTEPIADFFGPARIEKLVQISDYMSQVSDFEPQYRQFVDDMVAHSASTAEVLAVLVGQCHGRHTELVRRR